MRDFEKDHPKQIEITFLMQDWDDAYNVGGMFRVADALGCKEIFASGKTPLPPNPMIGVTSLGHHRRIEVHHRKIHEEAAQLIKDRGYTLVTLEIADEAVPYTEFEWPAKVCLALGNEANGIYPSIMRQRDAAVYIPMFGKGRSMNVHVSGAVAAYHAVMSTLKNPTD